VTRSANENIERSANEIWKRKHTTGEQNWVIEQIEC